MIKEYISRLRYKFFISKLLVLAFGPLHRLSKWLARWIQIKIKKNGGPISYAGVQIHFPKNVGINILSRIRWHGIDGFEPLTSRTLTCLFRECDAYFDIGSNFGFYSVLAQKVNTKINVTCFEPLPSMYEDNLRFHQVNKAVNQNVVNMAISNFEGEVKFYIPDIELVDSEITSASIEKDFFYNQQFGQRQITVKATTLDSILIKEGHYLMGKKLVLKIDVEGHERSVLEGGLKFFNTLRPVTVMEIEKSPQNLTSIYSILSQLNYCTYAITSFGYFRCSSKSFYDFNGGRDFLLIPQEVCKNQEYFSFAALENLVHHA